MNLLVQLAQTMLMSYVMQSSVTTVEMYTQQVTRRLWTDCQESIENIAFPGDCKTENFLTTAQRK